MAAFLWHCEPEIVGVIFFFFFLSSFFLSFLPLSLSSLVDSMNGPFSVHYCKVNLKKTHVLELLFSHSDETIAVLCFGHIFLPGPLCLFKKIVFDFVVGLRCEGASMTL